MMNYNETSGFQMNNQTNSNYMGMQPIMNYNQNYAGMQSMMNNNESCGCSTNNNQSNSNLDKCKCNCKFEFEPKNQCEENDDMAREEMAKQLKCYRFAIIELGLYLDTHPDDEKAICLHKEYANKFKDLADKYQRIYGPLTIMFPCNKWRWLEEPWPWERGNN